MAFDNVAVLDPNLHQCLRTCFFPFTCSLYPSFRCIIFCILAKKNSTIQLFTTNKCFCVILWYYIYFLSVHLSDCLIVLFFIFSICLIDQCFWLSILSVCVFVCLTVYLFILCLSVCLSLYLSFLIPQLLRSSRQSIIVL